MTTNHVLPNQEVCKLYRNIKELIMHNIELTMPNKIELCFHAPRQPKKATRRTITPTAIKRCAPVAQEYLSQRSK